MHFVGQTKMQNRWPLQKRKQLHLKRVATLPWKIQWRLYCDKQVLRHRL